MVDAQPPRMAEGGADGLAKRLVRGRTELMRDEGRQSPVLPQGVVLVRRCAHRHVGGEHVLPGPGIGAVRIDADGEVLHHRQLGGCPCQLRVEEPLQPLMEADAVGTFGREPRHRRSIGTAILGGPRLPSPAVVLGQCAEDRELLQGIALLVAIAVEGGIAAEPRP